MQHPVDTKAHGALLAPGLYVDIAGPLLKGALKQPVDNIHNVRVVGVRLAGACAQGEQLFEVGLGAAFLIVEYGPGDRFGQLEELCAQALDLQGVGNDPQDGAFECLTQIGFPAAHPGLAAGDGDGRVIGGHREDSMALGKGKRHQPCSRNGVNLERVQAQIRLPAVAGEPGRERLDIERPAGLAGVFEVLLGQKHQWVQGGVGGCSAGDQCLFGAALPDPVLSKQGG